MKIGSRFASDIQPRSQGFSLTWDPGNEVGQRQFKWSSLISIPQTDISLFIQLIRRTVYFRLQIYFNETKILNKLRRFTIGEAKSWTRIDGFTLQFPISTRLTRQPTGKANFLEYWNSSTQQNNWKLTVFKGVFRPKYCRSARHSLEMLFILELKL